MIDDTKLSSNSRSAAKSLRFENDDGISNYEYRNDDDLLHRSEAIQGKENCVSMPTTFSIFPEVYIYVNHCQYSNVSGIK
jgi:hypothetical protein